MDTLFLPDLLESLLLVAYLLLLMVLLQLRLLLLGLLLLSLLQQKVLYHLVRFFSLLAVGSQDGFHAFSFGFQSNLVGSLPFFLVLALLLQQLLLLELLNLFLELSLEGVFLGGQCFRRWQFDGGWCWCWCDCRWQFHFGTWFRSYY